MVALEIAEQGGGTAEEVQALLVQLMGFPASSARRAAPPVASAAVTLVADLDDVVESAECSCDAGDDNPF
ncbi:MULTISPECIES: hypothetical protein [unclassified Streptomyces]|uniref:hypothetical protein n=1 Tax=unclassified Streptomyces TaxID=2593676 RepID=UPI000BACD600|nr:MULTISPECIES: hypothetical protein [unclassified Streptomyces]ASY33535.1 hypothetical protein CAC01_13295 [Streptomyces sp. CLI2509]MYX22739.1 hypothetical protein [Streptomyces sp. SID8380]